MEEPVGHSASMRRCTAVWFTVSVTTEPSFTDVMPSDSDSTSVIKNEPEEPSSEGDALLVVDDDGDGAGDGEGLVPLDDDGVRVGDEVTAPPDGVGLSDGSVNGLYDFDGDGDADGAATTDGDPHVTVPLAAMEVIKVSGSSHVPVTRRCHTVPLMTTTLSPSSVVPTATTSSLACCWPTPTTTVATVVQRKALPSNCSALVGPEHVGTSSPAQPPQRLLNSTAPVS